MIEHMVRRGRPR